MPIATHIIKIEGTFNEDWTEEKLKNLVKRKIKEIDSAWHTDLELFGIVEPNIIKVWVYIQEAARGAVNEKIVGDWLKTHINEKGLVVKNFEIEKTHYEEGFVIALNNIGLENL